MGDSGYVDDLVAGLLAQAMPTRTVVPALRRSGTRRARVDLDSFPFARFAYLDPGPAATMILRLYPADTLEQARVFYGSPSIVARVLDLEECGWTVRPNFHFGFMVRGLCWTRSRMAAREFADYWIEHIPATTLIRRDDWDEAIDRLIADGIFDPRDRHLFDRHFVTTNRQVASPRPGLLLERSLPLTASTGVDPAKVLRREIEIVETAFRGRGAAPAPDEP